MNSLLQGVAQIWIFALIILGDTEAKPLCILPLGDSLTQGVGLHGSYRHFLDSFIQQRFPELAFTYTGTMHHTCTKRNPSIEFVVSGHSNVTTSLRHEGHCGWNSAGVLRALPQAAPLFHCAPDIVLLLVGTNDIFQVAKLCRIDEWSKMHATLCPEQHLSHLASNLQRTIDFLAVQFSRPKVFLGITPPSGFPLLDEIVHRIISEVGTRMSAVRATVEFTGWKRGIHTFDTTHPNLAGCELMAGAWLEPLLPVLRHAAQRQMSSSVVPEGQHTRQHNTRSAVVPTVYGWHTALDSIELVSVLFVCIVIVAAVVRLVKKRTWEGHWRMLSSNRKEADKC